MNALARFEGFMRDVMDRRVVRMLGGSLQPVELARGIAGCMEVEQQPSPAGPVVPNVFNLLLHPEDCADFRAADAALERKLCNYTVELARERGFNFTASPVVRLVADTEIERGEFRVEGRSSAAAAGKPRWTSDHRRRSYHEPARPPAPLALEVLGAAELPVDHFPYIIGRSPDCDLVLPDPRVSRRHAAIERIDGSFRVRDLGSRNGTLVNGQAVAEAGLCSGDRLSIGAFEAVVHTSR